MKRSPLRRGVPLRSRTPLAGGNTLRAKGRKKRAQSYSEAKVREAVFARDGYRCQVHDPNFCGGPPTVHHRRKASAGGAYSVENLVTLCAWANGWIEDFPSDARNQFPHLVVREGDPEWESLGRRANR